MGRKLFRWRRDWEYPRLPVVPARTRRRRFAASVTLTAVFFCGAALAAGAGNQLAQVSEDSTVAAATDGTATTDDTAATDATPTTTEVATTDAAPATTEPVVPAEPTTTDAASPAAAAPAAPDPAAADPATTEPATTAASSSEAAPAAPAPDSSDITVTSAVPAVAPTAAAASPQHHKAVLHRSVQTHHAVTRHTQNLPLVIPYHAISFDPQQWLNNNPGTPMGEAAVEIALNYLGVPYQWGGSVPATGFDCSGLTRFVYGQLGINLTHYAAAQFSAYPKLAPMQLEPGDLVFFEPKVDGPGHVAMYIGNDQMIEAPHTGAVVRISSFSGAAAAMGFLGAVRPYANVSATRVRVLMSSVEWGPAPAFIRLD